MILRRLGNKSKIAKDIQTYFPQHDIYIEPFFGAGGMFFNKRKAKYNILNDLDSEVFNLFQVVSTQKDELERQFKAMPISLDLWIFWKENQETDPIRKALRFLLYSNYGYMGKPETLRYLSNTSKILFENIQKTSDFIFGSEFSNYDLRVLFKKIPLKEKTERVFIYADPPYLETTNNYQQVFLEKDCEDLFDCLIETGCKFAYSEFDHPFILGQAEKRKLNVIRIGERVNMKNRRSEILVTNYAKPISLFD
jgi:DNA adenine methylase